MRISNRFLLTGLVVILIFVAVYQLIKSSSPIEIEIVGRESATVFGQYYEGDWKSDTIKKMFIQADDVALKCGGLSTAIYYNDPNEEDGLMKAFIGVANCESGNKIFSEVRYIPEGEFLKGKIGNDYFSIPQRIYLEMEEYANDRNIKIGDFSLEQYFSDTLMIVYIPIIEK